MLSRKNKIFLESPVTRGFTLVEVIVGIAVFSILLTGVLASYQTLAKSVKSAREKVVLASLSATYLEVVRNMPYAGVGTINGNPSGQLADLPNATNVTIEAQKYKIYYEVTYIHDPADLQPGNPDYKQVKMSVLNTATGIVTDFVTVVSPKGLISNPNTGAMRIQVINASGQPVPGALIHIANTLLGPNIILDRTSDATGFWTEVGLPASVNGYQITVTKNGFSTDQTYPITGPNPNPTKAHATVSNGQITAITFSIDLLSTLNILTQDQTCQATNGINVNVAGGKLIGTNPNVVKFNSNFSSSSGAINLNNIEWDTYTPTLLTGQSVMVYGTSPIQQISVLPNTSQTFTLILGPATANSLLVIVKDAATGVALENATVHLHSPMPADFNGITGGSVWLQTNWSGGSGQAAWASTNRYFADDGNVDVITLPTGLRLAKNAGHYVASGNLESSTFDTGGASSYTTITWQPQSQDPAATLKFQIASNADNTTWTYKGPDGTVNTYYTVSGSTINAVHNTDRYIRYKAFLSTTDNNKTPVLTGVNINYVAGCFTPGQVMFPSLISSNNYTLDVSLAGYQTQNLSNVNVSGNQVIIVNLSP